MAPTNPARRPMRVLLCLLAALLIVGGTPAESGSEEEKPRSALRGGGGMSPKFSLHGFADATFIAEDLTFPDGDDGTDNDPGALRPLLHGAGFHEAKA